MGKVITSLTIAFLRLLSVFESGKERNSRSIFLLNLLITWTLLEWIATLIRKSILDEKHQ